MFIASFISISFQDDNVLVVYRFVDFNKSVSTIKCITLTDKDNRISNILFPLIGYVYIKSNLNLKTKSAYI